MAALKARRGVGKVWPPQVLDQPELLRWDDAERDCARCKLPSHWRTERGRATHPNCEASIFDSLTTDAILDLLFALGDTLGGVLLDEPTPDELADEIFRRYKPIPIRVGQCSWCKRPGVGITEDDYLHCTAHMFYPFRWPPEAHS